MQENQNTQVETAAEVAADQTTHARGQTPSVVHMDEAGVQDIEFREVPAAVPELALVLGGLVDVLTKAGHPEPEAWMGSLENPSEGKQTDTKAGIFLANRALRLLITERRDIPEADRSGALLSIVDATDVPAWLNVLKPLVVPVIVKYNVGKPGLVKADETAVSTEQQEAQQVLSPEENQAQEAGKAE